MQLNFTTDAEDFQRAARSWLALNVPRTRAPCEGTAARDYAVAWLSRCHRAGWSGIGWLQEHGGRGLPPEKTVLWYEEYVRARAPSVLDCTFVSLNHAGPTLIACGTDTQKAIHLPRILSGDAIWCQGFSEPGSGSDLGSLTTRGAIDGEHLVADQTSAARTDRRASG